MSGWMMLLRRTCLFPWRLQSLATMPNHRPPMLADPNLFRSLFLVAFGGTLLLLAIRRLRTYRLRERYALLFVLIGLPFLGLAFWPDGVGWMAERLKIQYNTLALIGVSVFLFLVVFELLTIVSVQEQKITTLAQLVGILMEKQKLVEREHTPGAAGTEDSATSAADPSQNDSTDPIKLPERL